MSNDRWENLERYETPKERVRRFLWDVLCIGMGCVIAWEMAIYGMRSWDSGRASGYVTATVLAIILARLMWLAVRTRKHWWPLAPVLVAFVVPIVLWLLNG